MPTTPIRTAGEPPTRQDVRDLVTFLETGRSPNPQGNFPARAIDAVLQTDLPVSGHGDDLYLYEEDDIEWEDAEGRPLRSANPTELEHVLARKQRTKAGQLLPPKPHWRIKDGPLPILKVSFLRKGGDPFPDRFGGWKTGALLKGGTPSSNAKVNAYTWDLPEGATCPGRSAFCSDCYAVDMAAGTKRGSMMASRVLRLKAWAEHREAWVAEMKAEAAYFGHYAPVRIHVAGDFFNEEYTRDWIRVVRACPGTYFWAYTRSWNSDRKAAGGKALVKALEELRDLPNMTLFASFDPTMPEPPEGWLRAGIYGDPRIGVGARPKMLCPEITGTAQDWKGIEEEGAPPLAGDGLPFFATCRACGWCWNTGGASTPLMVEADLDHRGSTPLRGKRGDVVFPRHGSVVELAEPGSIPWSGPMPKKEVVHLYSVFRNGGGSGNRVVYSDAMKQLGRSAEKIRMAKELAEVESGRAVYPAGHEHAGEQTADSWMAEFYRTEFDRLLKGARVANRQIEKYWEV